MKAKYLSVARLRFEAAIDGAKTLACKAADYRADGEWYGYIHPTMHSAWLAWRELYALREARRRTARAKVDA